jgi:serine protease Do
MTMMQQTWRIGRFAAIIGALTVVASQAVADEAPALAPLREQAIRAAAEHVAPSVVRIETVGGLEQVGSVAFGAGTTTGLIADAEGHIVSSAFAFRSRPASILVTLADGRRRPARLVATDHSRALVLLRIDPSAPDGADADTPAELPVPLFAPADSARVGQTVVTVGRTFTVERPNLAVGIISATSRIWGKAIQTDAAVSPNNYGGPLIDLRGRVLGVLVPLTPSGGSELAGYEWYDSGIGFAVPSDAVRRSVERLRDGDDLHPGRIGINIKGKNPVLAEPVISDVHPNSPAADAGLKVDDRIITIDDRPIRRGADLKTALARRYAGEQTQLVVRRGDETFERTIDLVAKLTPYEHPFLGVLPRRDPREQPGVVVRWVYPDSPAAAAGVEAGDVLLAIDGQPLTDRLSAAETLARFQPGDDVELQWERADRVQTGRVTLTTLPVDVPHGPLPPAAGDDSAASEADKDTAEPADDAPTRGEIALSAEGAAEPIAAWVPEAYSPDVPHGLLVWLHASDPPDVATTRAALAPSCERHHLILALPRAAGERWHRREAGLAGRVVEALGERYAVDPTRVVVAGRESGGAMATLAAGLQPTLFTGVAAIDAPLSGPLPENEPAHRRAFLLAHARQSPHAPAIEKSIERIEKAQYPLTVWSLGDEPGPLDDARRADLVRWIDTLDRL